MNSPLRCFFFRWYWVLALILGIISTTTLFAQNVEKRWEISAAAAGIAASLIYFVQKQKVDEANLFQRLFTDFNARYRALHDEIQEIIQIEHDSILTLQQRNTLDQYFNLCAEEYLFWIEGRILSIAWESWCLGMWTHLNHPLICSFWLGQEKSNSHYGLTTVVIATGAGSICQVASLPCYRGE